MDRGRCSYEYSEGIARAATRTSCRPGPSRPPKSCLRRPSVPTRPPSFARLLAVDTDLSDRVYAIAHSSRSFVAHELGRGIFVPSTVASDFQAPGVLPRPTCFHGRVGRLTVRPSSEVSGGARFDQPVADTSRSKADFNVYLDGATKAAISGVRVYLTHSGASAFEIVVDDPELRWQDKPTFTECREVKIELGIPGKMKKVFDGEVTAWRTELERSGPTVLVLRGLDRSHRLMRGHKTKTYAQASPIDCAQQIASAAGLSAKTSAGQPAPVKTFRIQANESDFNFLRKMPDLEGYLFYVEGSDLHFERPTLSSNDDVTVTYGEDLKTFLPVANFRRPAAKVEVGAWDSGGKAALTGKAKPGDELWSVPGGKPGADVAKFQGTKASLGIVESQVASQEHADTVAKAALTRRSLEFLTAEVEVQGNPEIKPGAMVNVKKVGVYSGHYLVTEANHFFDASGYDCIFYVARDKWGDSSTDAEKKRSAEEERKKGKERAEQPYKPPKPPPGKPPADDSIDFTLQGDDGQPLANVKCKVKLKSGEVIEATTDADGHVRIEKQPEGPYTVEITGDELERTSIDVAVEDAEGAPLAGASGKVKLSDGTEISVVAV